MVIPAYPPLPVAESSGDQHPPGYFAQITSVEGLTEAWQMVLARDARDGVLQRQTQQIAGDIDAVLATLCEELRAGTYSPAPLLGFEIPKAAGDGSRMLRVPTIRDRIVERAVVNVLSHPADLVLSPCSFAYRTGVGRDDAIHHLAQLRDAGYRHVLRTDVRDYFPSLNLEHALAALSQAVTCPRTLALIRLIARPRRARGERRVRSRGIAQGSCLSPLLANLALNDVDKALGDAGYGYARFADDIVVCAPTRTDLEHAARLLDDLVSDHGLCLNEEKTTMTSFDDGFCYLGASFTGSQPEVDLRHDVKGDPDPDRVVYVGRSGTRVRVSRGRLVVEAKDGLPQMSIPRKAVGRLVLTGPVGLSAGARSWALRNDVEVVFLSRHGSYLGRLAAPRATGSARRLLAQAEMSESEAARLPLARRLVSAKLRHQVNLLHRVGRRQAGAQVADTCAQIKEAGADAAHAGSVDELMGLEGAASQAYFDALALLVPQEVSFKGRSRRPPKDLANAAFSYAYAILLSECTGALLSAGLEPSLGVLHASTDKRPSLALDLMEEFRPLLVDRTVMALLRTRRLRPEHATVSGDGEGVWLNQKGKKALVDGYEATMQRSVSGALPGFSGSWRRHVHHEAQLLGRAIIDPGYEWSGVSWR